MHRYDSRQKKVKPGSTASKCRRYILHRNEILMWIVTGHICRPLYLTRKQGKKQAEDQERGWSTAGTGICF